MRLGSLIAVMVVATAFVVPASAQDGVPLAGRYQLGSSADSSFVRLDTRTGAVSHCSQQGGVWRCEPIMDSGLADRLTALSSRVDRLSSDIDRLSRRVDKLAAKPAAPAPVPAVDGPSAGKPAGFAQTVVYRLLEMVRTLKRGRADQT